MCRSTRCQFAMVQLLDIVDQSTSIYYVIDNTKCHRLLRIWNRRLTVHMRSYVMRHHLWSLQYNLIDICFAELLLEFCWVYKSISFLICTIPETASYFCSSRKASTHCNETTYCILESDIRRSNSPIPFSFAMYSNSPYCKFILYPLISFPPSSNCLMLPPFLLVL